MGLTDFEKFDSLEKFVSKRRGCLLKVPRQGAIKFEDTLALVARGFDPKGPAQVGHLKDL